MIAHGISDRERWRYRISIFCLVIASLTSTLCLAGPVGFTNPSGSELTAADREALIKGICDRIEKVYPDERVARTTREGLLRKFNAGEYNNVVSPAEFAARMTADMESLSRDKHLDLYFDSGLAAEINGRSKAADKKPTENLVEVENARWDNFGFKSVRMLDGQVGYLDLRMFFAARYAGPTAVAAMEFLSGSRAVIVDLRRNGGGWDDMVTLLAGYFADLDGPDAVAVIQSTLDSSYSVSVVPSFVPGKRLTGIPVYLLTSPSTASAAEAFVSIVKHLNDSVVVVGQRTAGAENPVEMLALDDRFVLQIPSYKKIYFGGRVGWEGTGLTPDVEVRSDRALETAHLRALHTLQGRLADSLAKEKIQWAIDGYQAVLEPKSVQVDLLQLYSGRYRRADVVREGKDLFVQFDKQTRQRLFPISSDYFLIEGRDDLRIRFVVEHGRVSAMERIHSDGYRSYDAKQ